MRTFSTKSLTNLNTCDVRLQWVMKAALQVMDCTVLKGRRGRDEQEEAFDKGYSKVHYPDSKHNTDPSLAVDIVPYPIDWNDRERFFEFAGIVKGVAHEKGIKIRWGGDFKNFFDGPHFEIIE